MLQINKTGVCLQCLSHTGPAHSHSACSLHAHIAQALGCSARNHLWPALGCMHFPGLSTQVQVLRYSTKAQTQLGLHFVPFPCPSSSGD